MPRCDVTVILRIAPQLLDEVERNDFQQVELAGLQRGGAGRLVRHADEIDAVEQHYLAAGQAIGRLGARKVVRVADEDGALARAPFVAAEQEGAGAHDLRHRLVGVEIGEPRRHHHRDDVAGLAQRLDDEGEGAGEVQHEALRIDARRKPGPPASTGRRTASRFAQRRMEATQSSAVTACRR